MTPRTGSSASDEEVLEVRAAGILGAMDSAPLEAINAGYYEHYAWELRHLVEDLLSDRGSPLRVWLVWDCADLAGVFATESDAREFRADRVAGMVADFGPNQGWADAITITPAWIHPADIMGGGDRS